MNYEYLLGKDLFVNYSRNARPVLQANDSVPITVQFALGRIGTLVLTLFHIHIAQPYIFCTKSISQSNMMRNLCCVIFCPWGKLDTLFVFIISVDIVL